MTNENAEPYEWYKAIRFGEVIGEGPTPMPDEIRAQATEIQWMNPSKMPPLVINPDLPRSPHQPDIPVLPDSPNTI